MIDTSIWYATKRQDNWANRVTASRAVSVTFIPVGIVLEISGLLKINHLMGFLVFWAAFSDGLDGWLARVRQEETPIGVIGDPLADKIFTDFFLVYAIYATGGLWTVAVLTCVTLSYDIDNIYQRRFDIANAIKGVPTKPTMPATWLSKTKTALLFGFMMAVVYPHYLPLISVSQLAVLCLSLVLLSWFQNRRPLLRSLFD